MGESIRRGEFLQAQYNLLFDGQNVGVLLFQHVGPQQNGLESYSATKAVALRNSDGTAMKKNPSKSAALNETNNQPIRIHPMLIDGSQPLDPDQVWLALYATVMTLAFPSKDTILVEPLTFAPVYTNIKIQLASRHGSQTPRHWPPYLLYWVIIGALRQLPAWLLSPQGNFRETIFGIFEGDDFLGMGSCKWAWRSNSLTMESGLNETVA